MKKKCTTRDLILCALFTALSAIGAFIRIPVPLVPFTLQITFTTLAGLLLGSKKGAISIAVYVLMGLIGIPVFTQGGGFSYVLKPSFGFLVAFIIGAFVTGLIVEKKQNPSFLRILGASFAGMAFVYVLGAIYFYIICNFVINAPVSIGKTVMSCFVLVAPGNIALAILAALVAKRIIPILNRQNQSTVPQPKTV